KIRGIGSANAGEPLYLINGVIASESELSELNPNDVESMDVVKDERATAIYGTRGANGVVIITTKNGPSRTSVGKGTREMGRKDSVPDLQSIPAGIRSDFRDYGYWKPNIITNDSGEAKFKVAFPGNATTWETHVLAVDFKKKTGSVKQSTRAFKPLMAELSSPRFLIRGDETNIIGKLSNYTVDTVLIKSSIAVDGTIKDTLHINLSHSKSISRKVIAGGDLDTLKVHLSLQYDKYQDGEERKIPVFPIGVEESKGLFLVLDTDTNVTLDLSKLGENVQITATENPIKLLREDIHHVRNYEYQCTEQLSSKLMACLQERIICEALGEKFKYGNDINKIIELLKDRQSNDGTWGWWKEAPVNYWMTSYVLKALSKAERMGYRVPFLSITKEILPNLLDGQDKNALLISLNALAEQDIKIDYHRYIQKIETQPLTLFEQIQVLSLKQKLRLPYSLDYLNQNRKETVFGGQYFGEVGYSWYDNSISLTIEAYKVYKKHDSTDVNLRKIRQFFFESRSHNGWRNTYESASIVDNILIDILKESKNKELKSILIVESESKDSITTFPYQRKLTSNKGIKITKRGSSPVFFTAYTKQWNASPEKNEKNFSITSYFENARGKRVDSLAAGVAVTMKVEVKSEEALDYIMIEAPIPAGCSYGNNNRSVSYGEEVHKEYFKHKTSIFIEKIKEGTHTYRINLEPRYTGKYTLNPAKIEMMYYPTIYGREGLKKVVVE
ncbi:MAG TPA: alpha-2-macroglobulin family protein, partial [Cytophagaceae bacterium]